MLTRLWTTLDNQLWKPICSTNPDHSTCQPRCHCPLIRMKSSKISLLKQFTIYVRFYSLRVLTNFSHSPLFQFTSEKSEFDHWYIT